MLKPGTTVTVEETKTTTEPLDAVEEMRD